MAFARRPPPDENADEISGISSRRSGPSNRQSNGRPSASPTARRSTPTRQMSEASPNVKRRPPASSESPIQKSRGTFRNQSPNAVAAGVQDKATNSSAWPLGPGIRGSPEMKKRSVASTASLTTSAGKRVDGEDGSSGSTMQSSAVGSRASASMGGRQSRSSQWPTSNSAQRGSEAPLPAPLPVHPAAPFVVEGERQGAFAEQPGVNDGNENVPQDVLQRCDVDIQDFEAKGPGAKSLLYENNDKLAEMSVQDISATLINFSVNATRGQRQPTSYGHGQQPGQSPGSPAKPLLTTYSAPQGAHSFTPALRETMGQEPLNVSIELGQELVRRNRLLDREVRKLREIAGIPIGFTAPADELVQQVELKEMPVEWHAARGRVLAQELGAVCDWADEAVRLQRYVSQVLLNALQPDSPFSQDARQALVKLVAFPSPPIVRSYVGQAAIVTEAELASEISSAAHIRLEVERRLEKLGAEVRGAQSEQLQAFKERAEQAENKTHCLKDCLALINKLVPGGESLSEDALVEKVRSILEERDAQLEHLTLLHEKVKRTEGIAKELVARLVASAGSLFEGVTMPAELVVLQEAATQFGDGILSEEQSKPAKVLQPPAPAVVAALEVASAVLESSAPTPAASPGTEHRDALVAPFSAGSVTTASPEQQSSRAAQLAGVISRNSSPVYQARVIPTEDPRSTWPIPSSASSNAYSREEVRPVRAMQAAPSTSAIAAVQASMPTVAKMVPARSPSPADRRIRVARSPSRAPSNASHSPPRCSPTRAASRMAALCASCGNVFMADSNFCRKCGAKRPKESSHNYAPPPKVTVAGPVGSGSQGRNSLKGSVTPVQALTPATPATIPSAPGSAGASLRVATPHQVIVNGPSAAATPASAMSETSLGSPPRYVTPTGMAIERGQQIDVGTSQRRVLPWQFGEQMEPTFGNDRKIRPPLLNFPTASMLTSGTPDTSASSGYGQAAYPRSFQAPSTTFT